MTAAKASSNESIDPVTLSVFWAALRAIPEEMGAALARTAHSQAVREGQDFSTGLYDSSGLMVSQGTYSPGHLGAMPFAVQHAISAYPSATLAEGDGIILNDPYLGAGHLPDIYLISPVFWRSELIGYVVNVAHHVDVGGPAPGSQLVPGVSSFWQEGIRILPVKAFKAGQLLDEVARVIAANVRVPEDVVGDLQAQSIANAIGATRLQELFDRSDHHSISLAYQEIMNRCERAMRLEIARIPDGAYSFEDFFDDYGPNTEQIRVYVTVTVDGDEITIDWAGSSPQVPAAMNSYINYTRAYSYFAVQCLTDPTIPHNAGSLRPLHVKAPEGSFFNPVPPAPSGGRAITNHRIFEAIVGALAPVLPDRAIAASSDFQNPVFGGLDPKTRRDFVYYDVIYGGQGGRATKDGLEGIASVANGSNIPVEACEIKFPVLIERLAYVLDSAGAGQHRGGHAVRRDMRLLSDDVSFVNLAERTVRPPFGILGGRPGKVGITRLESGGNSIVLEPKGAYRLRRGDLVIAQTAGSGGYGDPLGRDPTLVANDLRQELVSAAAAREDYGVSVDPHTGQVNVIETEQLRAKLRQGNQSSTTSKAGS